MTLTMSLPAIVTYTEMYNASFFSILQKLKQKNIYTPIFALNHEYLHNATNPDQW